MVPVVLWILVVLVVIAAIRVRLFRALIARDVKALFGEVAAAVGPNELKERLKALPEPVRRHLDYAIPPGFPAIRTVRLRHGGYFRTKQDGNWLPIVGEEYFTVGQPGFVWVGQVRMLPLVWMVARDRLLAGRGSMLVRLCSMFTVVKGSGREIDQGSLMRWLAEVVWFPYGFVGEGIGWEAIDSHSARATLIGANPPVSAVFETDAEGRFVRITGQRYFDDGRAKPVMTRWVGICRNYREFAGLQIPASVEVKWVREEGEFSYARFEVTGVEYTLGERF